MLTDVLDECRAENQRLTAALAAMQEERDAAAKTADIRQRMVDIPTAWELTLVTDKAQHHEKCSYRVASMLCDCAACRVMEHVSGLLRRSADRAEQLQASLDGIRTWLEQQIAEAEMGMSEANTLGLHSTQAAHIRGELKGLRSVLARLPVPLSTPVSPWQPIETHDGNTEHSVLGWWSGLDEPVEMARQRDVAGKPWALRSGTFVFPTHWMPLPAVPSSTETRDNEQRKD